MTRKSFIYLILSCTILITLLALLFGLAGCRPEPPQPTTKRMLGFHPAPPEEVRGFLARLDPAGQGLAAFANYEPTLLRSLEYLQRKDPSAPALEREDLHLTWGQLARTAERLLEVLPALDQDPSLLQSEFVWFAYEPDPLMTGYYAPELPASLTRTDEYAYPLYGLPPDLRTLDLGAFHPRWEGQRLVYRMDNGVPAPYYDRRQIDLEGALDGQGLELAWARDPWDIYHLQVQGSGYLRLPDGSQQPILYAGKNGRPFRSVERRLLAENMIEPQAMHREGIRAALDRLGAMQHEVLASNPSYVFFRLADQPPVGSMGQPLTGRVSLATDPNLLPLGSVVPFAMQLPLPRPEDVAPAAVAQPQAQPSSQSEGAAKSGEVETRPLFGLGMAQDTGGVITGERIDYYMGAGPEAQSVAFRIKTPVRVFLLVAKDALPAAAATKEN